MYGGNYGEGGGQPPDKNVNSLSVGELCTQAMNLINQPAYEHEHEDMECETREKQPSNEQMQSSYKRSAPTEKHPSTPLKIPSVDNITAFLNTPSRTAPVVTGRPNLNIRISNKYNEADTGPFLVFIENKQQERLHPMFIGKLLFKGNSFTYKKSILDIISVGKSKVKVQCKDYEAANYLTDSESVNNDILNTFIPDSNVYKQGIVKYIDTSLTEEEIIEEATSNVKIASVRRFTKRSTNNEIIKLQTCIFKFEGQVLPPYIYIFGTRCEVSQYIPSVVICYNCLRYGHMSKQCKSKMRCNNCHEEHTTSECKKTTPTCLYCKESHRTTDRKCPEFARQTAIKRTMVLQGLSFVEANKIHKSSYANIVGLQMQPNTQSVQDFPELPNNNFVNNSQHLSQTAQYQSQNIKKHFTISQTPIRKNYYANHVSTPHFNTPHDILYQPSSSNQRTIEMNPYPPQYHRLPQDNRKPPPSCKEKLLLLIQTIIEETQKNNVISLNDLTSLLDSMLSNDNQNG